MVIRARRLAGLAVLLVVFGVTLVFANSETAHAENQYQFPGITSGTDWGFDHRSPDPNLTWLFKNSGSNQVLNGNTTHILRTRSIGRNKGTRLRVYFAQRPIQVSVNINVIACELNAPNGWDGNMSVTLGGQTLYNQPTLGRKIDSFDRYWTWQLDDPSKTYPYVLKVDNSKDNYTSSVRNNSPVCQNFGNSYTIDRHKEGCSNPNSNGTRCKGNGNESYSGWGTTSGTIAADGSPFNGHFAVHNALDGRTFSVNFPATGNGNSSMGFDSKTGLYFADLDIDLSSDGDPNLPNNPDIMQRITFNVNALNATSRSTGSSMRAKMGYRFFTDETQASKYFGLEGNGGRSNDFPGYGQKFAIPFGMSCGDTRPSIAGPIAIYDPDVGGYGPAYAMVFRRNPVTKTIVKLNKNDYTLNNNVSWDAGNNRIELTAGSNQNSAFTVNELLNGFNYMLVVVEPHTKNPPSSNVWSLRLPTDSINGLINCQYDLVPHLNGVQPAFSAYGDTLTPHGWITNAMDSNATGDHQWRITRAVYASRPSDLSRTTPMNGANNNTPCDFVASRSGPWVSCGSVYAGTYPADSDQTVNDVLGAYPAGTYVCYITSVRDPTWRQNDNNQWANSPMQCSVAGVKPKVRVTGFDLKAGGGIDTSLSSQAGNTFGSWGEYGVFSNGTNTNMASGSGLLGGGPNSQFFWSALTFANNGLYGRYGGVLPPSFNPGTGTAIGNVLGGTTFGEGDKRTLRYSGTLYITGNLTYDNDGSDGNGYNSIKDIPEIKIVADDIIVAPNVTQIDPWLVVRNSSGAYGRLSTCGTSPGVPTPGVTGFQPFSTTGLLTTGLCQNQLKLNAPVITDQLYPYRTSDAAGDAWAENFDLRASNFLSSYAGINTERPVARTELITELPPRF